MMLSVSERTRRSSRRFLIGAFLVAIVAFAAIAASGVNKNLVYYWTPADLVAAGEKAYGPTIRLGGMIAKGSIVRKGTSSVEFDVKDAAQIIHVKSSGVPPQMLREEIGVVVEGTMNRAGYFESSRLMISHSNEYRAPKQGHPMNEKELKKLMESVTMPVAAATAS